MKNVLVAAFIVFGLSLASAHASEKCYRMTYKIEKLTAKIIADPYHDFRWGTDIFTITSIVDGKENPGLQVTAGQLMMIDRAIATKKRICQNDGEFTIKD